MLYLPCWIVSKMKPSQGMVSKVKPSGGETPSGGLGQTLGVLHSTQTYYCCLILSQHTSLNYIEAYINKGKGK